MAKRFTDTEKWKKQWIRNLSTEHKLFWIYILDDCNHAGIWDVDIEIANVKLKTKLTEESILKAFIGKIYPCNNGLKWFVPSFIEFQYKGELNPGNKVHESVITLLKKEGLWNEETADLKAPWVAPRVAPTLGAKDKDKAKDKIKDKGKSTIHLSMTSSNDNDISNKIKKPFGSFKNVLLTKKELKSLKERFPGDYIEKIENLSEGVASKGYKYKSHYATILSWERKNQKKEEIDVVGGRYKKL